jgi:RNA polymerase sigma-70 factor, ECF subfamily
MTRGLNTDRGKEAFEELYDRVAKRLLLFLVRRMQDPEAAAELWSECWAIAFERWTRCTAAGPGEAEAWVFGIARKRLAGYYRSGAIERRALARLGWSVPPFAYGEDDELERVAELDALKAVVGEALRELPTKQRRAVQLRVLAGLSYRDVSIRLGCSELAARAQVSRGLRRLAKDIDRVEQLELESHAR